MNTKLGSGTAIHIAQNGSSLPICGGNKPSTSYRKTTAPATCRKCLAQTTTPAPKVTISTRTVTQQNGKLYGPVKALRALIATGQARMTHQGDVIPA